MWCARAQIRPLPPDPSFPYTRCHPLTIQGRSVLCYKGLNETQLPGAKESGAQWFWLLYCTLNTNTHGLSGFLFVPDYCDLFDGGHTLSATSVIRQIVAYKVNVKNCDSAAWKCGYVGDISVNDYLWLKSKGTCGWEMNEKENLVRATKVRYSIKWIGINHHLTNPGFILVQKEMKYLSVNQLLG